MMTKLRSENIRIIGAPTDLGASRRGVDMGPSALRIAGLGPRLTQLGHVVQDRGNVESPIPEMLTQGSPQLRHFDAILSLCDSLKHKTLQSLQDGFKPLVLGGDHSIAMGSVAGVSEFYRKQNQQIGLLWFDAHGDINTPESSPSGNIHGMPVAHLMGFGDHRFLKMIRGQDQASAIDPARSVLFGIRDLDAGEKTIIRDLRLRVITMREIDERGTHACLSEALDIVTRGTCGFHLSLDADWLDPEVAPGVGTRVTGGASYREAHLAMELAHDTGKILSMDMVEVNPILDQSNKTAELMVELALSAFGKAIL